MRSKKIAFSRFQEIAISIIAFWARLDSSPRICTCITLIANSMIANRGGGGGGGGGIRIRICYILAFKCGPTVFHTHAWEGGGGGSIII